MCFRPPTQKLLQDPQGICRSTFRYVITMPTESVTDSIVYLATEPIVTALAVWIGFAWSCLFLSAASTLLVFRQYGWNVGQLGSIQAYVSTTFIRSTKLISSCLCVGAILGFAANFHQEHIYAKKARKSPSGRAPPEARLYYAAFVGLAFPIGLFGFAWTGRPEIPYVLFEMKWRKLMGRWIVPAIFLVIQNIGLYHMYVGVL
jgi:uncharacterized membrane protein